MNMLDYIDWRGDITFKDKGFNEVDSLIFCELSYLVMDSIEKAHTSEGMTVAALYEAYAGLRPRPKLMMNDPMPALRKMAISERYRDVRVIRYVNDVNPDEQAQFSAVTYRYKEDEAYVAFRGTDDTLVGWREDFNMSFLSETYGQKAAVDYLNSIAAEIPEKLIVGGHSKGGNFAIYAAAFCDPGVRENRIVRVYSNDGPGFRKEVTDSEEYAAILPKIVKLVPESSLVGVLLGGKERCRYIKSEAKLFAQHDPYTWCVKGPRMEDAPDRSQVSVFMGDTIKNWLGGQDEEHRKTLVDVFFDSLETTGADTVGDLNNDRMRIYTAFMKALSNIDGESKSSIQSMMQKFIATGMDVMATGMKKDFTPDNKN